MALVYDTGPIDARERFDYWQDVVCATYAPTANRTLSEDPFAGSLEVTSKGAVTFSRITSRPIEYRRGDEDDGNDHYFVCLSLCAQAHVSQCGRDSRQRPGDIVVFDSARPYTCSFPAGDDQLVLAVPRALLHAHIPASERLLSRTLASRSPLGHLAGSMLLNLWNAEALDEVISEQLNGAFLDVLGSAFEAAYGVVPLARASLRGRQLERVKGFLLANLERTDLTVDSICAATHVSPRTLSRLFAAENTSVIRWLWQQRLAASHQGLMQGRFTQVSEAALSVGFSNLSHFSRAFKQAYGIAPGQLLRLAG